MTPHINARALIVEDVEHQAREIERSLTHIPDQDREPLWLGRFDCDIAGSVTKAQSMLNEARERPYDLLLLDLGLPSNEGELEEGPDNGFEILKVAQRTGSAKEVIIISRFDDYKYVRSAFRGGALDYLKKPYIRAELQARVLECWKRILASESDRILQQRIQKLFPYDENELANQFSVHFSSLIQNVAYGIETIMHELDERWGIDPKRDLQDSMVRHLIQMEEAVRKTRQEWADLQRSLSGAAEKPSEHAIRDLLENIRETSLPCLKVKNVDMEIQPAPDAHILSFRDDVAIVLKEIILGAIAKLPNYGEAAAHIKIGVTTVEDYVKVHFNGSPFNLDKETPSLIARAERQGDKDFNQLWGVSIAQHIALRGGGRLQFGGEENPESITYLIPRARHD